MSAVVHGAEIFIPLDDLVDPTRPKYQRLEKEGRLEAEKSKAFLRSWKIRNSLKAPEAVVG